MRSALQNLQTCKSQASQAGATGDLEEQNMTELTASCVPAASAEGPCASGPGGRRTACIDSVCARVPARARFSHAYQPNEYVSCAAPCRHLADRGPCCHYNVCFSAQSVEERKTEAPMMYVITTQQLRRRSSVADWHLHMIFLRPLCNPDIRTICAYLRRRRNELIWGTRAIER